VTGVRQLTNALIAKGFASTLYVCSIIPLVAGTPSLPLVVDANSNAFTRKDVHIIIMTVLDVLAERFPGGRLIGGVSDGDARLRNQALTMGFHRGNVASEYIAINHFLIPLRLPYIAAHIFWVQTLDSMHILWRLRVH
jgi:hypothetical protein